MTRSVKMAAHGARLFGGMEERVEMEGGRLVATWHEPAASLHTMAFV